MNVPFIRRLLSGLILLSVALAFPYFFKTYLPQRALPSVFLKPTVEDTLEPQILEEVPPPPERRPSPEWFQLEASQFELLEPAVLFWRDVYARYDRHQIIFHDAEDLSIIYLVLDFTPLDRSTTLTESDKKDYRDKLIEDETTYLENTLKRLALGAAPLNSREKQILALFGTNVPSQRLSHASQNVRSQIGLKDEFAMGMINSGLYLKDIELIFESYELPRELARLAFVESLFHTKAVSHAGAAGLWQLMPQTGRQFLQVSRIIDERYDPILASHAAAKLLKQNYTLLGTWPLAINAYNAGASRIRDAMFQLNTNDIATIMKNYKHPSYGFASRNFFAEFLAANHVYENYDDYFGALPIREPIPVNLASLPQAMTMNEVAVLLEVSPESLQELNPALSQELFTGHKTFPEGTILRVPQ